MGPDRPGRRIVVTGDTEPCEETEVAAHGAELLIHDSSFAAAEAERAAETGHSTAMGAAELAAAAGVQMLALVHISSRHFVPDILAEAQEVFPRHSRAAGLRPDRDPAAGEGRAGTRPQRFPRGPRVGTGARDGPAR